MQPEKFLEHFTPHLKNTIARAISLAARLEQRDVTPLHLLYALREEAGSVAAGMLQELSLESPVLLELIRGQRWNTRKSTGKKTSPPHTIPELNEAATRALEASMMSAYEHAHTSVGTEHLLFGVLAHRDQELEAMFHKRSIDPETLLQDVAEFLTDNPPAREDGNLEEVMSQIHELAEHAAAYHAKKGPEKENSDRPMTAIEAFTTDLTGKEAQRRIDPVIGREAEISRLVHILCRRTKNNPVLIGEPGVGKTAIVEGLAKRIAEGTVPEILKDKKILSLDLTLLIAGTIYRGEFEARLKQLMEELGERSDTILFIDEIHNIIGAGSNQGTMDAANILKPALARGLLHCIGATTIDEYQKHVTSDPALERRFQAIAVEEPTAEETKAILAGLKKYYEKFHEAEIDDDAIAAAVEYSTRYIHNNFLPDKAIDLLDEAAAAMRVDHPGKTPKQEQALLEEIKRYRQKKQAAIRAEKLKEAVRWKNKEALAQKKLRALKKTAGATSAPLHVGRTEIAKIVAQTLRLPMETIVADDWTRLAELPQALKTMILGQEPAIDELTRALRRAHLRGQSDKRPLASFLFAGPSGVGKTALAKTLAETLYHDPKALIKFDMSEFAESHSVSKLLGSPAGYVGYRERNRFTDELKKRPYTVLLFDEFDKAHPDVQKLLFQILDEGELTDSHGKKIFFPHTIIILTTNVGAELYRGQALGFGEQEKGLQSQNIPRERILARLKEQFESALLERLSSLILFAQLSPETIEAIVSKNILAMSRELQSRRQIAIVPDSAAVGAIAKTIPTSGSGARAIARTVEDIIHRLVLEMLEKPNKKTSYTLVKSADTYRLV